jgi:hypothetical protein
MTNISNNNQNRKCGNCLEEKREEMLKEQLPKDPKLMIQLKLSISSIAGLKTLTRGQRSSKLDQTISN